MTKSIINRCDWPVLLVMVAGGATSIVADLSFWQAAVLGTVAGLPVLLVDEWWRGRSPARSGE